MSHRKVIFINPQVQTKDYPPKSSACHLPAYHGIKPNYTRKGNKDPPHTITESVWDNHGHMEETLAK